MKGWLCNNCGHVHKQTDGLEELGFKWMDKHTTKTCCQNCGTYSLNRATDYDELGRPTAGYFLVVKSFNTIRKGKK
ncbi:hypothetical protein [Cytobacillus horneckiae]|uniref:hypothetical protein n=1 Tax=Cytobacillus horneckiae TaxID=549687 RepID=UPI003D9A6CD4